MRHGGLIAIAVVAAAAFLLSRRGAITASPQAELATPPSSVTNSFNPTLDPGFVPIQDPVVVGDPGSTITVLSGYSGAGDPVVTDSETGQIYAVKQNPTSQVCGQGSMFGYPIRAGARGLYLPTGNECLAPLS